MIAVSRCLYVVKSDIFDTIFARFNGKLLAAGIWIISILHIIPVFLEVHTGYTFSEALILPSTNPKNDIRKCLTNTFFVHKYMRTQYYFESGFKSPLRKVQKIFARFLFYLILTFRTPERGFEP